MMAWLGQTISYWQSGGLLLIFIALVCFAIWGLFLRSRKALMRTIQEGRVLGDALHEGALGNTPGELASGIGRMKGGVAKMFVQAVEDVRHGGIPREVFMAREADCLALLKRDLLILTALTAVAPLLGLLGTVMGMIQTFDAVATVSGNTGTRVAAGISQALITTQFGLIVAVPGVFGAARLQRMIRSVRVVMGECRAHVLHVLEHEPGKGTA